MITGSPMGKNKQCTLNWNESANGDKNGDHNNNGGINGCWDSNQNAVEKESEWGIQMYYEGK